MSSIDKATYYMEANGFQYGKEIIVGSAVFLSVLFGALLANWFLFKDESKTK